MEKEFLPIGSVVLLKEATRKVVIIGYTVIEEGSTEIWDYLGCAYPIGVIGMDKNLLFNRDQIDKVVFKGFLDEEGEKFHKSLIEDLEKIKK